METANLFVTKLYRWGSLQEPVEFIQHHPPTEVLVQTNAIEEESLANLPRKLQSDCLSKKLANRAFQEEFIT